MRRSACSPLAVSAYSYVVTNSGLSAAGLYRSDVRKPLASYS